MDRRRSDWPLFLDSTERQRLRERHVFEEALTAMEIEGKRDDVGILHIRGTAVETSAGLRLELGVRGLEETVQSAAESYVLRPSEILERYPELRLCIVQAPPHLGEPRVDGDRREAGRMRRIGSSIVIVDPSRQRSVERVSQ